jgi:hypothetical protein
MRVAGEFSLRREVAWGRFLHAQNPLNLMPLPGWERARVRGIKVRGDEKL